MRVNRVGGGDVSEMSGRSWITKNTSDGDDYMAAGGKRDESLVSGYSRTELDSSQQSGRDRLGIDDGTRIKHGAVGIHGTCSEGADGL